MQSKIRRRLASLIVTSLRMLKRHYNYTTFVLVSASYLIFRRLVFIHIFDGSARKFLFGNCLEIMRFQEKAQIMDKEYASDACQLKVKVILKKLRFRSFMKKRDMTKVLDCLEKMVDHINQLVP